MVFLSCPHLLLIGQAARGNIGLLWLPLNYVAGLQSGCGALNRVCSCRNRSFWLARRHVQSLVVVFWIRNVVRREFHPLRAGY